MRHPICLMILTCLLLSPLTCRAQSGGSEKKQPQSNQSQVKKKSYRVVITLKTGEKIEGWQGCDYNFMNCHVEITQNGFARTIPGQDIAALAYKRSFWRKTGETTLTIVLAPLLFLLCRKDCEL